LIIGVSDECRNDDNFAVIVAVSHWQSTIGRSKVAVSEYSFQDAKMVERRSELNRRYHRKKKLAKLKAKLHAAKDSREKEHILKKIRTLSPLWQEPTPA
jgi:hypothetical protein